MQETDPPNYNGKALINVHERKGREEEGERKVLEIRAFTAATGQRACEQPQLVLRLVKPLEQQPLARSGSWPAGHRKTAQPFSTRRKGQCLWCKHFTTCCFW